MKYELVMKALKKIEDMGIEPKEISIRHYPGAVQGIALESDTHSVYLDFENEITCLMSITAKEKVIIG